MNPLLNDRPAEFFQLDAYTVSFSTIIYTNNATHKCHSTLQVPILHRAKPCQYGISSRTDVPHQCQVGGIFYARAALTYRLPTAFCCPSYFRTFVSQRSLVMTHYDCVWRILALVRQIRIMLTSCICYAQSMDLRNPWIVLRKVAIDTL